MYLQAYLESLFERFPPRSPTEIPSEMNIGIPVEILLEFPSGTSPGTHQEIPPIIS